MQIKVLEGWYHTGRHTCLKPGIPESLSTLIEGKEFKFLNVSGRERSGEGRVLKGGKEIVQKS